MGSLMSGSLTVPGKDFKAMRMLLETRAIPYQVTKLNSDERAEMQ
jgi:hypothetical protein